MSVRLILRRNNDSVNVFSVMFLARTDRIYLLPVLIVGFCGLLSYGRVGYEST